MSAASIANRVRVSVSSWRGVAFVILLPAFAVMWAGGVLSHWSGGAHEGQGWLASLFLLLAGLLVLLGARSLRSAAALVCVALGGFVVEVFGARTGLPFGVYEYTDALRPQLFGVPLVMGLAWMVLIAYAREVFSFTRLPVWLEVLAAALWTTAIDLVIDPLAANELGYWRWSHEGAYYDIPFTNFAGWFLTSVVAYALFRRRLEPNLSARIVGLAVLLFFTLIALASSMHAASLAGGTLVVLQFAVLRGQGNNNRCHNRPL